MRFQTLGNKKQFADVMVRNSLATAIPKGAPVFFKHDADTADPPGELGNDVIGAASLDAGTLPMFAGFAMAEIPSKGFGNAQAYGIVQEARIFLRSRAASTNTWASVAAHAVGESLVVITATATIGTAVHAASRGATVAAGVVPWAVMAQSLASIQTAASSDGGTDLVSYGMLKVFVRSL